MRCCRTPILFVTWLTFSCSAMAAESPADRNTPRPLLSIPKTPLAPKIDGRVEQGEWRWAAKTTGFLNLAAGKAGSADQTTFYVTYDDQRLYAAFECELPAESLPDAAETRRDGSVWTDDSVEMLLCPPDGKSEDELVHFVGNSLGTIRDDFRRDMRWNGRWEYKTQSGRGGWSGELSIPWEELGVKTAPVGQTWRANFCRSVGKFTAWADSGKGYIAPPDRYGYLRFVPEGVVVQLGPIAGLEAAQTTVNLRVSNLSDKADRAIVGVRTVAEPAAGLAAMPEVNTPQFAPCRQSSLAAGTANDLVITVAPPREGPRRLEVSVVDEAGTEVFRQAIPYISAGVKFVALLADPSEEKVFVQTDLRGRTGGKTFDVKLQLENAQRRWKIERTYCGLLSGRVGTTVEDIRQWPLGSMEVRAQLIPAGETKPVEEAVFRYERVETPRWYTEGREVGVSRKVLKPWTPIRYEQDRLEVWGRQHDLADSLIVDQVTSAEKPLLAAPVALEAKVAGHEHQARLENREALAVADDRVAIRSRGSLGPIPLQLDTTAEYDGMFKFELTLQPSTEPLERLCLKIPLNSAHAIYYNLASSYYAKGEAGAVPAQGMRLPFMPFVSLGDTRRGITWFAESTQGWLADKEPIRVKVDSGAGTTTLCVEFVGQAVKLEKPRTIVFGLQATPVKPVPADWRAWRTDYIWPPRQSRTLAIDWKSLGVPLKWRLIWWTDGPKRIFSEGFTTPLQILPAMGKWAAEVHKEGIPITPYFYLHGVSGCATGFERYYPVWQTTNPRQIAGLGDVIHGACPSSPFGDYLLYGWQDMVKRYGVDGLYFDGGGPPVPCSNELHDHGWIDENGARQYFYPIFGLRELFKRLQTLLQENVEQPVIWVHSDGKMAPPVYSFITATWEGEMVQGPLRRGDTFLSDLLSLEFCRAHQLSTQWGVVVMWLPSNYGTPEQRVAQSHDCMALMLLHGTPIGRVGSFNRELLQAVWKAQADFDTDQAEFYGYWENSDRLQLSPDHPRIKASLYQRGDQRMVIVSNFTTEPQGVEVKLLGSAAPTVLRDTLGEDRIACDSGRFKLIVPPKSFRMLVSAE